MNVAVSGPTSEKIVFFGHHKAGSRFMRLSLMAPLAKANGYEVLTYSGKGIIFNDLPDLDLQGVDWERFGQPGPMLLNLLNASPTVVDRTFAIARDLRGVHVVRDPRQMLVSAYFHHREGHPTRTPVWEWPRLAEVRERLLTLSLEDGLLFELETITGDVLDRQLAAWTERPEIVEFRVEDFLAGDEAYDRLVAFLALPEQPDLKRDLFANPDSRKWRDVFTPSVTAAFEDRFSALLERWGYDK